MYINVDKCNCITFHRKSFPIGYNYKICNSYIKWVGYLGVILDRKLYFKPHMFNTLHIYRASIMLGFIRIDELILCAFVRFQLEYDSMV